MCARPATRAAAFDSWTGTYRTRSAEFFRNTNTEIQPKLFCNTCAELPITACGVCGGFESVGEATMVWRHSRDSGYETLDGLMCKAGCDDMRRSVAFARNSNISMQQRFEDQFSHWGARMGMTANEFDAAVQYSRNLCSARSVEGVKFT